ncbi:hypothetical protein [Psychrobacter sp. BF1]|uniref:hypothetical protein n=1 Tax=Psychrobacter sp. BF1 TaxID=2821147 RepID=UPI001C4E273E|nr:hypothetical protein [Psychrobacter sp. BF1]
MKKILKWFLVFTAVTVLGGIVAAIFETDEQAAARELENKQAEVAAAQVKAGKLQDKADKQAAKDKVVSDKKEQERKAVKTLSGIPNLGGMSEAELLTDCQVDIQNKLNNPRSMDIIHSNLKYKKEPNHELWFQFYVKNQFNAESRHTAMCEFDNDGNLLSSKFE